MNSVISRRTMKARQRKVQGSGRATWHQRQLSLFLRAQVDERPQTASVHSSVIAASAATEFCQ